MVREALIQLLVQVPHLLLIHELRKEMPRNWMIRRNTSASAIMWTIRDTKLKSTWYIARVWMILRWPRKRSYSAIKHLVRMSQHLVWFNQQYIISGSLARISMTLRRKKSTTRTTSWWTSGTSMTRSSRSSRNSKSRSTRRLNRMRRRTTNSSGWARRICSWMLLKLIRLIKNITRWVRVGGIVGTRTTQKAQQR